jgi:hypothetical protein
LRMTAATMTHRVLARRCQSLSKDFEGRVEALRAQRGEVYGLAKAGVAGFAERASATQRAPRLNRPRREAGERRHGLGAAQFSDVRQLCQDRDRRHIADPRNRGEQIPLTFELGMPIDVLIDCLLDLRDLPIQGLGGQSKPAGRGQLKTGQWSVGTFKTGQ